MSRFAVLLVGSALMLIVAACDTNGDDDGVNGVTDDTTEIQGDNGEADDTDVVVPEDDDDVGLAPEDDAVEPGDDEMTTPDDEAIDPDVAEPGLEDGMFFNLTFEEAQDITPFEIHEPGNVPESIEFQSIMGMASPQAPEEERGEEAATIMMSYVQPPADEMQQGLPVELTQSIEMDMRQGLPPEAEQEEMAIGDREVTRISLVAETGDEIVAYMWQDGDIFFSLAAILGPDLDESELEDMVASVPTS